VEAAFRKYSPRIYGLVRGFLDNDADAEDVMQQVFVKLLRKHSAFAGKSAFPTWLSRVAVNEALKFRERRARQRGLARDRAIRSETAPPSVLLAAEEREVIERAVARLPAPWREAVTLADLEGQSAEAIARSLGINVSTIKSRLHRGRQQLRRALAAYFQERD
jgi:RNA polymerase sigma-70 factor (ECF subfamily)